ncbi:MAG: phosphoribosylanthranilate isomerase [Acidobacteriota bacterium]|nr:phosphoribosylanthranilate isomerase [Acidobacteriota bacterium]
MNSRLKNIWIKICGTTSVEDAESAVAAGANSVGFIFASGPRRIAPLDARNIVAHLPASLQRVGVFVNEKPERVREVVTRAGMTAVQLHGDETPQYVRELFPGGPSAEATGYPERRRVTRIFKAIRMDEGAAEKIRQFAAAGELIDAFLLDSPATVRGGSGKPFDWDAAAALMEQFKQNDKLRFVIAGGLRPGNVQDAIRKLRPWGVDVVSGVEKQPGVKDEAAVRSFIDKVREVEATL